MANARRNTNKNTNNKKPIPKITARIDQINDNEESSLAAFASVNIGGAVAIHGLRIFESEKGRFVSMPTRSYTDRNGETKYADIAHPITAEAREAISEAVLAAYDQELSENEELSDDAEEDLSDGDLSFEHGM